MWYDESVVYQIYPLGLCGAPAENDGKLTHRILRLLDWIPHMKRLGVTAVLLNPVFDSDRHGYDTRDYRTLDPRLGDNADLQKVCQAFHDAGMRVILDGVLNHMGKGSPAFQDALTRRGDSPYQNWFTIYPDGHYETWEGFSELPKLNLDHPEVVRYLCESIQTWVEEFDIDGLRLDVAYCLPEHFLKTLRRFTAELKDDFLLLGETLHGDYKRWMGPELCHSVTNYECYKGLWSSFNSMNLFEICHSLQRQFGSEPWALYRNAHLLSFLDNHDVTRIASQLTEPGHLPLAYAILFGMPGVPCIYYGSEWGIQGRKGRHSDAELRPALVQPQWNDLTDWISLLAHARQNSPALCNGDFRNVVLTNRQAIFERKSATQRVLVAINADSVAYTAHFDAKCGTAVDLLSGKTHDFGGGSELPPYSAFFWNMETV